RDLAEDQRRSGVGTRVDTTRAEVALARQRTAWIAAQNARDAAGLALLHAIGADQSLTLELTDPPESENVPAPPVGDSLARARAGGPSRARVARGAAQGRGARGVGRTRRAPADVLRAVPGRLQRQPHRRPVVDAPDRGTRERTDLQRRPHLGAGGGGQQP